MREKGQLDVNFVVGLVLIMMGILAVTFMGLGFMFNSSTLVWGGIIISGIISLTSVICLHNPHKFKIKLSKKAKLSRIIGFLIVVLVVILLVFLIKNSWDMQAAAQDILGLFGAGKK